MLKVKRRNSSSQRDPHYSPRHNGLPSIRGTNTTSGRRITTGIITNRFKEDSQNLRNFRSAILRSVDTTQISDLAADCLHPRDILLQLKGRLCPATDTHINDLLARYDHLQKTPKTRDLEKWTRLWQQVVRDLKKVGEKTDTSAKRAYYFAAQKIDESLADQLWVRDRGISPKTSFDKFSNEFVSLIRSMRSNTELSSSRSSFATVTSEPTLTW